jgi:hypothetical protein
VPRRILKRMDPDDNLLEFDDNQNQVAEIHEELADYNDSAARAEEDGWFYSDED